MRVAQRPQRKPKVRHENKGGGCANGVRGQTLKADGTTRVTFTSDPNQAINTCTTTSTSYAISPYACYDRTSTPVSSGNVRGIAACTLNYR